MRKIIIQEIDDGKKIFNYVKTLLPGIDNSDLFKFFRKKIITVNQSKVDVNYHVKANDMLTIYLKDEHFKKINTDNQAKFHGISSELFVVFEDKDILAVNKPAGIIVHPDENNYKNTLQQIVCAYLYKKGEYNPQNEGYTPSPCHRLDRNTSGVIVFAKNFHALKNFTGQLRDRKTKKIYVAISSGCIDKPLLIRSMINNEEQGVTVASLKMYDSNIFERSYYLENFPKESFTLITPIKSNENASLLTIELWTGRKHQIRAHLKAVGSPILGDHRYKSRRSVYQTGQYGLIRPLLHSYSIEFEGYPVIIAQIPDDITKTAGEIFDKT